MLLEKLCLREVLVGTLTSRNSGISIEIIDFILKDGLNPMHHSYDISQKPDLASYFLHQILEYYYGV